MKSVIYVIVVLLLVILGFERIALSSKGQKNYDENKRIEKMVKVVEKQHAKLNALTKKTYKNIFSYNAGEGDFECYDVPAWDGIEQMALDFPSKYGLKKYAFQNKEKELEVEYRLNRIELGYLKVTPIRIRVINEPEEKLPESDYKKIYKNYIRKHSLYKGLKPGEYGNDKIKLIYKFDDIDGDGIPEFLYEHKHIEVVADFAHILTIKNGKVIPVDHRNKKSGDMSECIGELGWIEYYPGNNIIRSESIHAEVRYIFYYSIDKDGKFNEEASLIEVFHENYIIDKGEYKIGMKDCTKAKFKEYESRLNGLKSSGLSSGELDGEKDLTEEAFN